MSNTLGLDPVTWDLHAVEDAEGNWNWPALSPCAAVVQNIRATLQTCRGEWFLDTALGLPIDAARGVNLNLDLYESEVKAAILSVEGVGRLTSFSLERDTALRRICVNFTGFTTCGEEFGATV
ncbi:MAG: hypothetical protein ACPGVT_07965 [Maricaulaceae bacterium]